MKDHAKGMAVTGSDPAHAVAQINAIEPARPLHWPMMNSKGHGVAPLADGEHALLGRQRINLTFRKAR